MGSQDLAMRRLLVRVRACTVCASSLPLGPRPVVQASATAAIVIVGQAPGRRVHESGVPWNDASGRNLREWLDISPDVFYDASRVALIPMGLCYPGTSSSGDNPPRPECAPLWHGPLFDLLPTERLEVIVGSYALRRYLDDPAATVTATIALWSRYLPSRVVLPHPSPRNRRWLATNPWFEAEVLPVARERVRQALEAADA